MSQEFIDFEIKTLRPTQLGCLRRKELDTAFTVVWEKPNGELYAHPKGQDPVLQKMKFK